jgi:hypothetical protein
MERECVSANRPWERIGVSGFVDQAILVEIEATAIVMP